MYAIGDKNIDRDAPLFGLLLADHLLLEAFPVSFGIQRNRNSLRGGIGQLVRQFRLLDDFQGPDVVIDNL